MLSKFAMQIGRRSFRTLSVPSHGLVESVGTGVVRGRRTIVTVAEQRIGEKFETPVPPDQPLLRTTYDSLDTLRRNNPEYSERIVDLGISPAQGVDLVEIQGKLWATGVSVERPDNFLRAIQAASRELNVPPEQLANELHVKNLNHPSDSPARNIGLHSALLEGVKWLRETVSEAWFGKVHVLSHPKNPKLPREGLEELGEKLEIETEVTEKRVQTTSVSNDNLGELAHQTERFTYNLSEGALKTSKLTKPIQTEDL